MGILFLQKAPRHPNGGQQEQHDCFPYISALIETHRDSGKVSLVNYLFVFINSNWFIYKQMGSGEGDHVKKCRSLADCRRCSVDCHQLSPILADCRRSSKLPAPLRGVRLLLSVYAFCTRFACVCILLLVSS